LISTYSYGGEQRYNTGYWWQNLGERDHLEGLHVDRRIILRWIFEKWNWRVLVWIYLAQGRDKWRAFVNAVMNLRVP
jgi:hypothetical protein